MSVHAATLAEMEEAWQAIKAESRRAAPAIAAHHVRPPAVDTRATTPSVSTTIAPSRSVLKIHRAGCFQPGHHVASRMTEQVVPAGADQCDLRPKRLDEPLRVAVRLP